MAAIGSLVFCTDCGNLLDGSSGDKEAILTCEVCGTENKGVHKDCEIIDGSHSCSRYRYFINHNHNKIKTFGFPFSATIQAISCTELD